MRTSLGSTSRDGNHRAPALPDVVEEHLEEFGYLSIQRRKMMFSPEVGPRGLSCLEARLDAHRDGLLEAGRCGIELASSQVLDRDPWRCYAGVRIWLELAAPSPDAVLARLHGAAPDALPSWREALRQVPPATLAKVLPPGVFESASGAVRPVLVDAWSRAGSIAPEALYGLAAADDTALRSAAARAIGLVPGDAGPAVRRALDGLAADSDRDVAHAALWSLALLERETAAECCRRRLERDPDPFTVQTLGLIGEPADGGRILPLVAPTGTRCAALRALGDVGDPTIVELLLRILESDDGDAALAAGDAFETLVGPLPPASPSRSPRRSDAWAPEPLDAVRARRHWETRRASLQTGRRWLRGKPFPDDPLPDEAPMERRWRQAVCGWKGGRAGLRHEVPDGFFEAAPTSEAIPGA